jgi:hypothetical protein
MFCLEAIIAINESALPARRTIVSVRPCFTLPKQDLPSDVVCVGTRNAAGDPPRKPVT